MKLKEFLFSKKYGSLRYKLSYFFEYKIPFSSGWNEYHNPLHPWWMARKYFKFPYVHFIVAKRFWMFGMPINRRYYNRIISINLSSLGWKSKWDSPRHEWDPYIQIVLFRTWHIIWLFNYNKAKGDGTRNIATWEAVVDFVYYDRSLKQVAESHVWIDLCNNEKTTILDSLTKKGLKMISSENMCYK